MEVVFKIRESRIPRHTCMQEKNTRSGDNVSTIESYTVPACKTSMLRASVWISGKVKKKH